MPRPCCPGCAAPVDRLRDAAGVVAAYPCTCWLTPAQADRLRAIHGRIAQRGI